jgi:predicted nucleic acid-binding protein
MPDYLLDSNVLIQHLRNHRPTSELLIRLALDGHLGMAAISRTEVLAGMRDHERGMTLHLLDALACYALDREVADCAGELIRQHRQAGTTLDVPDAIIAATALVHDLVLVTYYPRHFPTLELKRYGDMPGLR